MSAPAFAAWSDLRDEAIAAFKGFPPASDEAALVDAFERSPAATRHAFERILDRYRTGQVRAPWRIWALECRQHRGDIVVSLGPDREKSAARAETWMRVCGLMSDVWDEVDDELFGERGYLRSWPDMRPRFEALWTEFRPGGERIEAEAEARAARWVAHRKTLAKTDPDRASALARLRSQRAKEASA